MVTTASGNFPQASSAATTCAREAYVSALEVTKTMDTTDDAKKCLNEDDY